MFDNEFLKWLMTLGVGGVLAGVMFWFYRKDVQQYTEVWKGSTTILLDVIQKNTASNVQMIALLDAMHRRLDADDFGPESREHRAAQRAIESGHQ